MKTLHEQDLGEVKKLSEFKSPSFELGVIYANFYREIKRFLKARSRVIGSIIQPLFWIIFFGIGWASAFGGNNPNPMFGGISYLDFLLPGVVMMTVFFAGFFSGISVIFDMEFGYLKEILVSPAPRWASLLGRALGSSVVALLQGFLILLIGLPLTNDINIWNIHIVILAAILVSLAFTGLGILLALKIRSHEGFQLIVNFLGMPILFSSGAFFPIDTMPEWMKAIAYINPLTYAVDISRYALVGQSSLSLAQDFTVLTLLVVVFGLIASYAFEKSNL